jgi:hypothetical protein
MAAVAALGQQQIQVVVNGNPVQFEGQGPEMNGDRVLVPLRGVLEQMGAHVDWNPATQTVSARRAGTNVMLHIGETTASVNGEPVTLDVPAQIVGGSTMVPLRFVGEALGENVHWNAATSTVTITTGGDYNIPAPPTPNQVPPPPPPPQRRFAMMLETGTVIPVTLQQPLSSDRSFQGDRFDCRPTPDSGLPDRFDFQGYVADVRPQTGNRPGVLELHFDRLVFPDGRAVPMNAGLFELGYRRIGHHGNHLWAGVSPDTDRVVFAGYGAGAGVIVGLTDHLPLRSSGMGAYIGGNLGALNRRRPMNVHLTPGMRFGVRLNQPLQIGR